MTIRPRRVLVYATGPLDDRLAGPEIRALDLARALSAAFPVTIVAQRADACVRDGIPVLPGGRRRLLAAAARHDVVVSPALPPYLLSLKSPLGIAAVADRYDPYELELVSLPGEDHGPELRTRAISLALQLRHADLVLCANAPQREALIQTAARLGRGRRRADRGTGRRPPAGLDPLVIPFTIPEAPPATGRRLLRERFPQIGERDRIVLWWGTVWRWLDVDTVIRAFARIASQRTDVKLVICAGRPPKSDNRRFEATSEAIALARELRQLGSSVFFIDEWVPYEDRHDYMAEAALGVTLHRSSREAALAARARYLDYLSAGLPCVLGRGDETAAEFEAAGCATLVDEPQPDLLATILLALLDDPVRMAAKQAAARRLAAERRAGESAAKLRDAVASLPRTAPGARETARLLGGAASYYGHRAVDGLSSARRPAGRGRKYRSDASVH